jgi:hypothetical protein
VAITQVANTTWAGTSGTNTSSALDSYTGVAPGIQMYYVANPTVGTGHTFSFVGWARQAVIAFAGVATTTPFDVENGQSGGLADGTPGSITPSVNGEVVVCGLSVQNAGSLPFTLSGGFTITANVADAGGVPHGIGMGYLIQTTAAAANPQWTTTGGSTVMSVDIASFKEATGGGAATSSASLDSSGRARRVLLTR